MSSVYATIWIALAALVVGEFGRGRGRRTLASPRWALACSAAGVALAAMHTIVALGVVYDWNHAKAVDVAAHRAGVVYGWAWRGSLYVNYVFLAWWAIDSLWWWLSPRGFLTRGKAIEWSWRLLAFVMVINSAVVFASPDGRIAGVPMAAGLLMAWWLEWPAAEPGIHHAVEGRAERVRKARAE